MKPLLFSTRAYSQQASQLAAAMGAEQGEIHQSTFPDGERYLRLQTPADGRDVFLFGGTSDHNATLDLFDIACGLVQYGARRLTMIVPYFGYSTMERAVMPGDVVTAKNRARLLSAVPPAAYNNRLFLVDLHVPGLEHYFEGGLYTVHVYAKPAILKAARKLGGEDFVLACTDAGRAKWVESLANDLGVEASFVFKRRIDGSRTRFSAISAAVSHKNVIIYDDMIRTGGSLISAAEAYKAEGAKRIHAIATHGILPGNAIERLRDCGLFSSIVCTDSHPQSVALAKQYPGFFSVLSLANVLADALKQHP